MDKDNVLQALGQVQAQQAGKVFRQFLRGTARAILIEVMAEEVTTLCGAAYYPSKEARFYRAGSTTGYVYMDSRRENVARPRVRQYKDGEVTTKEVTLRSYAAAQDAREVERLLIETLVAAGSMRKVGNVVNNQRGTSSSQLSRLWQRIGREKFLKLRDRSLNVDDEGNPRDWLALMVDGVSLAKDLLAVVAIGITTDGKKVVLDFEVGASENLTTATALIGRVVNRGFAPGKGRPLLVVLDGSDPLRIAVVKHFPDARIQRCLVHKERNLRGYLPRRDWPQLNDHLNRLRKAQGATAALDILLELDTFLATKNTAARRSLHEAGLDLIRLHLLDAPSTLHVSLLSTNLIKNIIRNFRYGSGRVTRWRRKTDQPDRWLATGLLTAEEGFQRLSHYHDLSMLVEHLNRRRDSENLKALGEKLPDWLYRDVNQVEYEHPEESTLLAVGVGAR